MQVKDQLIKIALKRVKGYKLKLFKKEQIKCEHPNGQRFIWYKDNLEKPISTQTLKTQ